MSEPRRSIVILYAEDDQEDQMLMLEAMKENQLAIEMHTVKDGEELMDYLYHRNKYAGLGYALPDIILLDLNMPRKDGREALKEIKADPDLRRITVVVLTTSKAEEDILRAYDQGISSFIVKPMTFSALVEIVKVFGKYWFEIVELSPIPYRRN